jgi:hypothetical protein
VWVSRFTKATDESANEDEIWRHFHAKDRFLEIHGYDNGLDNSIDASLAHWVRAQRLTAKRRGRGYSGGADSRR